MDKKYALAMVFDQHIHTLDRSFNGYSRAYVAAMDISLASHMPVKMFRWGAEEVATFERGKQVSGKVRV